MSKAKYYSKEELSLMVGQEVKFKGFGSMVLSGVITKENDKYWLPFSGKVNAETVEIELLKSN